MCGLRYPFILFVTLGFLSQNLAENVPKLLILKINNFPTQSHVGYLEESLTDALREKLRQKYIFDEMEKEAFDEYVKANFYQKQDFYTETVSLKLGLELGQNVVISGRYFTIKEAKNQEVLIAQIKIFDINQKKVVASIEDKSPLSQDMFNAIDRIADRVVQEASQVLPDPITWRKMGYKEKKIVVVFDRFEMGFRGGAFFYRGGYTSYFKAEQPNLGFLFKVHFPLVAKNLFYQAEVNYQRHSLKSGTGTILEELNQSLTASNYHLLFSAGYDFQLGQKFCLSLRGGSGLTYQTNLVTGEVSRVFPFTLPIGGLGLDFGYDLKQNLSLLLSEAIFFQKDGVKWNQIYTTNLGINFKF